MTSYPVFRAYDVKPLDAVDGPVARRSKAAPVRFYSFPVGYDAVKEAYAAKALYKATAAFVCTNATCTRQARRTAAQLGIQLTTHATLSAALNHN